MDIKFTEEDILERGVEEIIERSSLEKKLNSGKKLRVKFGIDPTSPDIHLGHTAPLWKLRQFQELGHTAVLIIGDYTALIGDPSNQDKTRPLLTEKEIKNNYKTYKKQALKILKKDKLEVRKQSEWFDKFTLRDQISLMSKISVGSLLSHDTFKKRLSENAPFASHELMYPIIQGYDSVMVNADVELGAIEQKFNILMGREIQRYFDQDPQDIVLVPYLLGTDGKEKMSKSLGNYIAVQDEPFDMFGKVMNITDEEIIQYFELITPVSYDELRQLKKEKISGINARDLKIRLAKLITEIYWGEKKAKQAQEKFGMIFQKREIPEIVKELKLEKKEWNSVDLLVKIGLALSKNEARRQIQQGAVYLNNKKINSEEDIVKVKSGDILRVGRRNIVKIKF